MTDNELRQLIESNARAIKALGEKIEAMSIEAENRSRRLDAKLNHMADIMDGNFQRIVRAETGVVNNEGSALTTLSRLNKLEERIEALENNQ